MKTNERIKLDYISPGQQFKNYKMFCHHLGISPNLRGKSRQLQIKRIKKYIDYEKEGQSIFITDVNEKPLAFSEPIIIESENPHTLYFKYIQLILMQILTNDVHDGKLNITNIGLFKLLGLVNNHYGSKKFEKGLFIQHPELKNMSCEYNYTKYKLQQKLIQTTKCALDSLEKQGIINIKKKIRIFIKEDNSRFATSSEQLFIEKVEYHTLKQFGFKNTREAYLSKISEYYKEISKELNKIGIDYYRKETLIFFNNTIRVKSLPSNVLIEQKEKLNLQLQDYLQRTTFPCFSEKSKDNYDFVKKIIIKAFIAPTKKCHPLITI